MNGGEIPVGAPFGARRGLVADSERFTLAERFRAVLVQSPAIERLSPNQADFDHLVGQLVAVAATQPAGTAPIQLEADRCARELALAGAAADPTVDVTAEDWMDLLAQVRMLRACPPLMVRGPDDAATELRKCALGMALEYRRSTDGAPELAGETLKRAGEYERFLLGVDAHPSVLKTALALEGQEHVQLRTRDGAIDTVVDHFARHEGQAWRSLREHASAIVDALLEKEG